MAKRTQTNQARSQEQTPAVSPRTKTFRRWLGAICLPIFLMTLIALLTYDWRDIVYLCNPPNSVVVNRVGVIGAYMTYYGYNFAGLAYAYFYLPLFAVLIGFLLHGHVRFFRLRVVWILCLYVVFAALLQALAQGTTWTSMSDLELKDAGGFLGKLVVDGLLLRLVGEAGVHLLLWPLMAVLMLLIIGLRNVMFLVVAAASLRAPKPESAEGEQDIRDLLKQHAEGNRPTEEAEKKPGFFARLFRRAPKETAPSEDVRDLLAARRAAQTAEAEAWSPQEAPREDEPLFAPRPAPVPPPKPAPAASDFSLQAEPASTLKPVSPLKAVTSPVPAVNDNDDPEAMELDAYQLPSTDLLDPIPPAKESGDDVQSSRDAIESVYGQFGLAAEVVNAIQGPVLTQFEVRPDPAVKVEKYKQYQKNLMMALRAESIRIQAPIPGRDVVGIEVPNSVRQSVTLREILEGPVWKRAEKKMALPLALGKLATGGDLVVDLAEMPHLLVGGGTGSGKSVTMNDMLIGLLMSRRPDQLRLLMVDPKRVEFTAYDDLPHLLNPVVVEPKKVLFSLRWAVVEMNKRYKLLQRYGVRNITDYNKRVSAPLPHRDNPTVALPYIVIVIDELADLMLSVKADIEPSITSLTQKARAAGIHMIIATQRPTTDIVTGTIKANISGRLALRVAQANDSRTIIDSMGAENLIGKGDMLFSNAGPTSLVRSQAAWVSDAEIARVCDFIRTQVGPAFDHVLAGTMDRIKEDRAPDDVGALINEFTAPSGEPEVDLTVTDTSDEGLYQSALEYIRQTGRFSTSALQRRLKIGYNKAGRITDMLEERGIIGAGGKAGGSREILVDLNAIAREELTGTDGEDAAFDTRSKAAPGDAADDWNDPSPEDNVGEDDFDLGDFDPSALDAPDVIHPSKP